MTGSIDIAVLIGAAVLFAAVGAVRISTRLGVPSLLFYLALGVAIGEAGLGIRFDNAELTRILGTFALVVIIAEGGLTARWSTLRPVLGISIVLATVGILVSTAVVGVVAHYLVGLDWRLALIFGAVLSPTDAAAIFSTLRRLRLSPRLAAILEAESGMNDAPAVLLVLLLSMDHISAPWWQELLLLGYELAGGAVLGGAVGWVGSWVLRRGALPAAGLYPVTVIGLTVLAYAAGSVLHASGFMAVYVAGVVLGNARVPHRQAVLGFADALAWLCQIGLFVLLGLLVSPQRLDNAILPAIVVGLALIFLGRPLSVIACVTPFRLSWREQTFLSWAALRGAVPVVLATIPLSFDVPGANRIFDAVFVLVVVFTLVQASLLPLIARKLRVTAPTEATELTVDTAPLARMNADLLQLDIEPGSRLSGVYLDELRLPVGAVVTLIVRSGTAFVPSPDTRLRTGDSVLIVATAQVRDATERRLRAVSRRGRLARWFNEDGRDRPEPSRTRRESPVKVEQKPNLVADRGEPLSQNG